MRIDLQVPYQDKDRAKQLGAKWDGIRKCWYIVDKEDLTPFMGWMPKHLTMACNIRNPSMDRKIKKRKKQKLTHEEKQLRKIVEESHKHFKSI